MARVVTDHLTHEGVPRVDALIKLIPFLFGTTRDGQSKKAAAENGVGLLKELDIPVFSPVVTMYMSLEQWHASDGLTLDTGWAVAMPEFEGVIEPVFVGTSHSEADGEKTRQAVPDRCKKLGHAGKKMD